MTAEGARAEDSLRDALEGRIEARATRELDPVELAASGIGTREAIAAGLEALVAPDYLTRTPKWICPVATCRRPLADEDRQAQRCPSCDADYRETGDEPVERMVYRIEGELSRDIAWTIVAHGMNTRGPWQEEFSWRLANKVNYSAPVLIHKYGMVRLGVLLMYRHRQLVETFGRQIREAIRFAVWAGRVQRPDVILHSFGTLMFAQLLNDKRFDDLKFGRVILAGSIVPPSYNWAEHLDKKRLDGVLNHCGDKDWVVELAAPFIPGSGPSGRRGLRDTRAFSILAKGYNHSTFFEPAGLRAALRRGGVWDRFLRLPL